MRRVTGLGGIFFKSKDVPALKEWYQKHLEVTDIFQWKDLADPDAKTPAMTVWSPFKHDTDYFDPSDKPWMINYRVENLVQLIEVLRSEGVTIAGEIQEFSYGKFAWILDPEGTKIELWEPKDDGF